MPRRFAPHSCDPEQQQWGRDHHQQQVLEHVDGKQKLVAASVNR
jgi:hypothetical protein